MMANTVQKNTNFTENNKKRREIMEEIMLKKVGTIYRNIANECLIAWYPDMPYCDRSTLLECGSLGDIEAYIGAKNSIDAAIEAVREGLEKYQIFLPTNFSDVVYFSNTPNSDVEKLTMKISENHAIDRHAMADIAVYALDKIHQCWIEDNKKKFFDPKRRSKRFMFLPIEMIGWEEVLKDYVFLCPILQLLCIRPETYKLQRAYKSRQSRYSGQLNNDGLKNAAIWEVTEHLRYVNKDVTEEEIAEVIEQTVSRCSVLGAN